MLKSAAALALAGVIALTTCGGEDDPQSAALGEIADGSDRTVQVFSYEQPWDSQEGLVLSEGMEWSLADVEICMKDATDSFAWNFDGVTSDNRRYEASFSASEPALDVFMPVAEDECVRGNVSFQVPIDQRPVRLIEEHSGATVDL